MKWQHSPASELRAWRPDEARLAASLSATTPYVTVRSADPQLCPRYSAALIENVTIQPAPAWMQRRLLLAGMRPINNIVDITNYCMLEMGQPLHAFDYETLSSRAVLSYGGRRLGSACRRWMASSALLTEDMLLITDDSGPIALAGVMGGATTEVSERTRHILLESANFYSISIRRTSQALRLASEAAQRFGRGVDSALTLPALVRASRLMEELGGGTMHADDCRYLSAAAAPTPDYAPCRGGKTHSGHGF